MHHSLAGERLTPHVDLGMFLELVKQPSVKLFSHSGGILLFACLYFLFLLFITPESSRFISRIAALVLVSSSRRRARSSGRLYDWRCGR